MLTEEIVKQTFAEAHNGDQMEEKNLKAFMRFAAGFDALDSESWAEAQAKIVASMDILTEDVEEVEQESGSGTAQALIRERLHWLK